MQDMFGNEEPPHRRYLKPKNKEHPTFNLQSSIFCIENRRNCLPSIVDPDYRFEDRTEDGKRERGGDSFEEDDPEGFQGGGGLNQT